MPEPVQGTAVLRKFVTIQSHKKPHRDATQRHRDVALNRFNFCYNTLFCQLVFQNQSKSLVEIIPL